MEREIVIKGMILDNLKHRLPLEECIKEFLETKKDKLGFSNKEIYMFKNVKYYCVVYQSKTKIFIQFRNEELEND